VLAFSLVTPIVGGVAPAAVLVLVLDAPGGGGVRIALLPRTST
jgi:hypothetical protein